MQKIYRVTEANRTPADIARLDHICAVISQVPEGAALIATLNKNGVKIGFENGDLPVSDTAALCLITTNTISSAAPYHFTIDKPEILLRRDETDDELIVSLIHEGRHAVQALNGNHPGMRYLSEDDYVTAVRFAEADAHQYTMILCMKLYAETKNFGPAGKALRLPEADKVMAQIVPQGPAMLDHPAAQAALFNSWFQNAQNVKYYDESSRLSWQGFGDVVRQSLGFLPTPLPLTDEELRPYCATKNGNFLDLLPDSAAYIAKSRAQPPATHASKPSINVKYSYSFKR